MARMAMAIPMALAAAGYLMAASVSAQSLQNPGFESGWGGWTDIDPNKDATAISGHYNQGIKSAKITKEGGSFEQAIRLFPESDYELTAYVKGPGAIGIRIGEQVFVAEAPGDGEVWQPVTVPFTTASDTEAIVFGGFTSGEARFDDFALIAKSGPALAAAEEAAKGPREYAALEGACTEIGQLGVREAADDGTADGDYVAARAIDHDFDPESRWSSKTAGKELLLSFGLPQTLKELGIAWYKGDVRRSYFEVLTSVDGNAYAPLIQRTESGGQTTAIERYDFDDRVARFIKIVGFGNEQNEWNSIVEIQPYGCGLAMIEPTGDGSDTARVAGISAYGLKTDAPPSVNFDLSRWKITIPLDQNGDGTADEVEENALSAGWTNEDVFFTDRVTGGMVFRSDPSRATTTPNSSYARSELREMLRAGDESIETRHQDGFASKNNWVFGSAPEEARRRAGGVDGEMTAKLAINQVTRLGDPTQVGRAVIGQIHAKDDEPIRLYYRKLPTNKFGSIYYAHEIPGQGDHYVELIGARGDYVENPADGIALDEVFSYTIAVRTEEIEGRLHPMLHVSITRDDGTVIEAAPLDMVESGYSAADEFMYFKAGIYTQNNTSNWPDRDFDQATFFDLDVRHNAPAGG